jgi:hypothetical protein
MPKGRKPNLGQVSFRLPPKVHVELLEIAGHLGLDLSSLLNQMIAEAQPAFLKRATEVAKQLAEARREALHRFPPDSPGVLAVAEAGRGLKGKDQAEAMGKAAMAILGTPTTDEQVDELVRLCTVAGEVLDREAEEEKWREYYEHYDRLHDEWEATESRQESKGKKSKHQGGGDT